jgi:hypothetical protein
MSSTIRIPDELTTEDFEGALGELLRAANSASVRMDRSWVVEEPGDEDHLMVEITRVAPRTDLSE